MKSLSEIETTTKRASKAIGFSWGIAEEIAKGSPHNRCVPGGQETSDKISKLLSPVETIIFSPTCKISPGFVP